MTKVLNEITLEVPLGCGSTDSNHPVHREVGYLRNIMEAPVSVVAPEGGA